MYGILTGQEIVYPEGYDILSAGAVSPDEPNTCDTVMVSRILINSESFSLANCYIVDNLPHTLQFIGYDLSLNGQTINHIFENARHNNLLTGYDTYRWVIDEPSPDDTLNVLIAPGDTLELAYLFTVQVAGEYILPYHSFCFYANQSGFFVLADPESLIISQTTDYGSLSGMVSDIDAGPVEGALIAVGQDLSGNTDGTGYYFIDQVFPATYDINVSHPAYADSIIEDITVNPGQSAVLDIILRGDGTGHYYLPGDINGDNNIIGSDITYGVNYFRGTGAPPPDSFWNPAVEDWHYAAADGNGDCLFLGSDITYLISYFRMMHDFIEWCPYTPPY